MGFWGKLGKGLLKAAPIAAAFIPGVGPLASMAIGAGTSALSKKLDGGSWKAALGSGAIGGATGFLGAKFGGKLPGLGGAKGAAGATSGATGAGFNPGIFGSGGLAGAVAQSGSKAPGFFAQAAGKLLDPDTLHGIGSIAGGMADSAGKGRKEDYDAAAGRYNAEVAARTYQDNYDQTAPRNFLNQARRADVLQNYKGNAAAIMGAKTPEELEAASAVPTYTQSQDVADGTAEFKRQMLDHLNNPSKAPVIPELAKAGKTEDILGMLGFGADALSMIRGYRPPTPTGTRA